MDGWMFGCDVCQDVCPWNRFARPSEEPAFRPSAELLEMNQRDWEELTEETFRRVFKKSAVKRTKFQGLQRNIRFLNRWRGSGGFTDNQIGGQLYILNIAVFSFT